MSKIIEITDLGLEYDHSDFISCTVCDNCIKLTDYIIKNNIKIKRGDIIAISKIDEIYRNDDKYLWDGSKVTQFYFDVDDYGSISPQYVVDDDNFSPDYWCKNNRSQYYLFSMYEI